MGREFITAQIVMKLLLWDRLSLLKVMALLLLMLVAAGPPGASGAMEKKRIEDSLVWCVCYQQSNTSEHLLCRLEGTECLGSLGNIWKKTIAGKGMNCTHNLKAQDPQTINISPKNTKPVCGENNDATISAIANESNSFTLAVIILVSSAGMLILILLCVGVMSMILKKWKSKKVFEKQRRWNNFLFKSKAVDYQSEAIYCNVINLVAQKKDDFDIYGNMLYYQCPRKTSPNQVKHPSTVVL